MSGSINNIADVINELYDVLALANAAKSIQEPGRDGARVLDVLGDRLFVIINRLDELDRPMVGMGADKSDAGR